MATNPVRRIRLTDHEGGLDLHIADLLHDFASLPPSLDSPYLTVSLDWTPSFGDPGRLPGEELRPSERRNREDAPSTSRRPARTWFEQRSKALLGELEPRSEQHTQLSQDIDRINRYLDEELDAAASGVYIVSNAANNFFEPLALGMPVESSIETGPLPSLGTLAHVSEDFATYAILVVNQQEAELSFVTQGTKDHGVYLESSLFPRRQRQGSVSERNYRERADQRVFHFARVITEELTKALREAHAEVLVLVGSEVFMNSLLKEFSDDVNTMIAGTIPYDLSRTPSASELVELTAPFAIRAERQREADAVASLRDILGGGQAVAGTVDVLNALQSHQVQQLIINEDYHELGWADLTLPLYGIGPIPEEHPAGGDVATLIAVDLVDAFVRLALQTDGAVEFVHTAVPLDPEGEEPAARGAGEIPRSGPATLLDEIGGVGATLRFSI